MRRLSAVLLCLATLAVSATASTAGAQQTALRTALLSSAPRQLAAVSWWGGTYAVPGGEHVELRISMRYPQSDELAERWVNFFAGMPHGAEMSLARIYVAPLDEVEEMCSSQNVLGCYGGATLVTVGDWSAGYDPYGVAAHEYGHHIAASRDNTPWRAIDWGTKRWATQMGICSRVRNGQAYPGDEGWYYALNPGEGFAEAYRVLVQTAGGPLTYDWPIVDSIFRPTPESLAAIREDVLQPWAGPTKQTIRGKFLRGRRTWSTQVATPLDGDLRLRLTVPGGGANDVALLSGDGRTVLATGSWTSLGGKSLTYQVCGARSVQVRVTRGGAATRFTLQLQVP